MFEKRSSLRGTIPEHLKERFRYLDDLVPALLPAPWRALRSMAVGGLWHVGFAVDSDLLLVISSSGRGVIDCLTGEKVARDDADYYADSPKLEAEGIGPIEGQYVRLAGIHGGGLSHVTKDGWLIELHPLSWPEEEFFLCPPGQTMLWNPPSEKPTLSKIRPCPSSLVAYGFSPTGKSLVIATSSDLTIYSRA